MSHPPARWRPTSPPDEGIKSGELAAFADGKLTGETMDKRLAGFGASHFLPSVRLGQRQRELSLYCGRRLKM